MYRPKIKLIDMEFAHAYTMQNGDLPYQPGYFQWYRGPDYQPVTVYTDRCIEGQKTNSIYHIAVVLEPEVINPRPYQYLFKENNWKKFDYVYTHHYKYVSIDSEKIHWYRYGGTWLLPEQMGSFKKEKDISILYSWKRQTKGHLLRWEVGEKLKDIIDVFGGMNTQQKYIPKFLTLAQYRASVIIENCKVDYYVSEKLIDCLLTKTIPIYWGPELGKNATLDELKEFDEDGIIQNWNSVEELKEILQNINLEEEYKKRKKAIDHNYKIAKRKWAITEDALWFSWPREIKEIMGCL